MVSGLGKEPIEPPPTLYLKPIINTFENINQLGNYLINQVDEKDLEYIKTLPYPIPKTWHYLPDDLREMIKPVKDEFTGIDLMDVREVDERLGYEILTSNPQKLVTIAPIDEMGVNDPNQRSQEFRDELKRYQEEHNQP